MSGFRKLALLLAFLAVAGAIVFYLIAARSGGGPSVIHRPGSYHVGEAGQSLRVWIGPGDTIVRYEVRDATGQTLIASKERASCVGTWGLFWDHKDRLWLVSSDIGTYLWERGRSGAYEERHITYDDYLGMPVALKNYYDPQIMSPPASSQKELEWQ
jgi:hypothetical protein